MVTNVYVKLANYVVFSVDVAISTVAVLIQDVYGAERLGAAFERRDEFHLGSVQALWGDVAGCQEKVTADEDATAHLKGVVEVGVLPSVDFADSAPWEGCFISNGISLKFVGFILKAVWKLVF